MAEGGCEEVKPRGRHFGSNETFSHNMVAKFGMSYYMHVGIFHSSEKISEENIKDALVTLVEHQEILQMKFEAIPEEVFEHRFVPKDDIKNIDIQVKTLSTLNEWKQFCENSVDVWDFSTGQLWKVCYLPVEEQNSERDMPFEFVLVYVAHHSISDAVSVFDLLYRQYMPILSAIVNKADSSEIIPVMPMLEPSEVIFQGKKKDLNNVPWYLKLGLDLLRWKNRNFGGHLSLPQFKYEGESVSTLDDMAKNVPEGKLSVSVYPVVFSKDLTSAIIKTAKKHGVTVHCVLLAVNNLALCSTAEDAGVSLPKVIKHGWPNDLRKFANIGSPHPVSCLNGGGITDIKRQTSITEVEFWNLCQTICKNIKKQNTKEKSTEFLCMYKYFNDEFNKPLPSHVMKEIGLLFHSNISNIGNCDSGPTPLLSDGPVKLDMAENYFMLPITTPKEVFDFIVCFHTVSTFNGKMMWNAGYNPMTVTVNFVDKYMTKIEELLNFYCKQEGTAV